MGDSFFTFYHPECSYRELEVPKLFVSSFLSSVPEQFILKSTKGISNIVARKNGNSLFFSGGWPLFVKKNNLLEGDFLTFHFKGESRFEVEIFGLHACRKDADMSDISGTRRSIWATSSRGWVSTLLCHKEELKSGSEEEGSGGCDGLNAGTSRSKTVTTKFPPQPRVKSCSRGGGVSPQLRLQSSSEEGGLGGYSGAARRRRRALSSSPEDGIRGARGKVRRSRTPPCRVSSGTLRSNKVTTKFPPQTWAKNHRRGCGVSSVLRPTEELLYRSEERVYDGDAQRMGRTPLPTTEDDSTDDGSRGGGREIWRERTLHRRLSSGRDGPKAGTSRSNKVLQSSSQRMGRTPLPTTEDDSTKDDSRGGGRKIWRERTLPRRLSGGRDGHKAGTSRSNKVLQSSSQRMGRTPLPPTEDDNTDDGSRGGGREIWRERTLPRRLSSGRDGLKAGVLKINRATTRFDPPPRPRNHGSGGLLPEEELRSGLKEEAHGGYSGAVQRVGRASLPTSEDDSSDGSRGGDRKIRRNRTPTRHLSSGRHGPKPGVSGIHRATTKFAPRSQASKEEWSRWLSRQNSATGQTSRPGLKDDSSDDSRGSGGRIHSRTPLRRLSSGGDGPKAGVLSTHRATARFDPPSSGCGASARLRPKEEPRSSSEEEGRGGYARGGGQQLGRASCFGQKRWRRED